jgi:chromosome segregation ATPase
MSQTETTLLTDPAAELRREQDRLAKLWQAYKLQEDELNHLRKERPQVADAVAQQELAIANLRRQITELKESAAYQEKHDEMARQNKILLIEVENLNREVRAAQAALADHQGQLGEFHAIGVTKESVVQLQTDLLREQERLAKLYKAYQEQEQELTDAKARLAKWESWFTRMEPAITALPKFFADAPRA